MPYLEFTIFTYGQSGGHLEVVRLSLACGLSVFGGRTDLGYRFSLVASRASLNHTLRARPKNREIESHSMREPLIQHHDDRRLV
jgi:hypothetical protein